MLVFLLKIYKYHTLTLKKQNNNSTDEIFERLTPLLGTQSGVPCLRTPPSMITPITMGSLELKMNCGRTFTLAGKTATCLSKNEEATVGD